MNDTSDYPAQFRQYILNGLAYLAEKGSSNRKSFSVEDGEQAIHLLDQALQLPAAWSQTRSALLTLASLMEQAGFRDEWIGLLERGLTQSVDQNDDVATAEIYYFLGILYERRGRHAETETAFNSAAQAFAALNLPEKQAQALNRLGQLYRRTRRYDEATAVVQQAFELLSENDPERGYGHLVLGNTALDRDDLPTAMAHFNQSYQLWAAELNKRMMGWSLTNIGMVHRRMEQFEAAIESYNQAIHLLKEVDDPINVALTQMNLGNVYLVMGQPDQAMDLYQQAKPIFERAGEILRLGKLYNNIGLAHHQLQQWAEAETAFEESLAYFQALDDRVEQSNTLGNLNETYRAQGKPEQTVDFSE